MKKRGVSPLIAIVLITAFVIILFVLVTAWVRRSAIEPGMETEGKIASTLECSEIDLRIINACINNTNSHIKINIDNNGRKELYGINLKTIGTNDITITEITELNLAPLDRYTSSELELTNIGNINKIEIYPIITAGTCQGQVISTTNFKNVQDQPLSNC